MKVLLALFFAGLCFAQPPRPYNPFDSLCYPNQIVAGPASGSTAAYPICRDPVAADFGVAGFLQATNNLNDVTNVSAARGNLGLGTAAVFSSSAFLQTANNLSDIGNPATARTNLGITYQLFGYNGTSQTARNRLNLIPGANITITPADNPGSNSTDVTIASTASGGGGVNCTPVNATGSLTINWNTAGPGSTPCTDIEVTLTGNVTSVTFSNGTSRMSLKWIEGGTAYTVSGFAGSLTNWCPVIAISSTTLKQNILYDGTNYDGNGCISSIGNLLDYGPTGSALGTPASGNLGAWRDSAGFPRSNDSSSNTYQFAKEITGVRYGNGSAAVDTAATAAQVETALAMPNCAADGAHALTNPSGTMNCTSVTGSGQTVYQTRLGAQAGVVLSGNTDTTLAQSNVIASGTMGVGGCYEYDVKLDISPTATNPVTIKIWLGSAATSGTALSVGNLSASPIWVQGTVCNHSGSTTAQTMTYFLQFQQSTGGFAGETTAAFNTGTTNAVISVSGAASAGETVTIWEFAVKPLFPVI